MKVTQLLRPDGKRRAAEVDLSEEGERLAAHAIEKGVRFYAELIPPDTVYLSAEHTVVEDTDVANRIAQNGPKVIEALEAMVRDCAAYVDGLKETDG